MDSIISQPPRLWNRRLRRAEAQQLRLTIAYLLALVLLVALAGTGLYLVSWPDDGVLWSPADGQISYVDPQGPSAGVLQPGDVILGWDDVPFHQVIALYSDKAPGDPVTVHIARDGQVRTVAVMLAAPSLFTVMNRLSPLVVAFAFWAMGVAVLAFNPTDNTAHLFYYVFGQAACGSLVFGALSTTGLLWASRLSYTLLWCLGPLLVHLHLYFPRRIRLPRQQGLLAVLYGVALTASLHGLTGTVTWLRSIHWFQVATYVSVSMSCLLAIALLVGSYRRAASPEDRQKIRLVVLGAVVALLPLISLVLLPSALLNGPFVPFSVASLFLLAIPGAYGYGIIRYRLIRLEQRISRRISRFVLVTLLVLIYLMLEVGLDYGLAPLAQYRPVVRVLFAFVVVVTYMPLRDRLQKRIDWAFYGGWYSYPTAVQTISSALDQVTDRPDLIEVLPRSLSTTLRLECSCLLLRDQGEDTYLHKATCPYCRLHREGDVRLQATTAVGHYLQRQREPVTGSQIREKLTGSPLTPAEQQLLACAQDRLWVPLWGRDGLLGILILGRKVCDDVFNAEDYQILTVVARQASDTLQNLSLLIELQQRAADVERLHQQLILAREEERKRLARELHDEIMQALVSLNYGLSKVSSPGSSSQNGPADKLQQQVHHIMGDLRRICRELRPPALDSLGLVAALRSLLRDLEAEQTLQVDLTVLGDEKAEVPEELGVCLVRVLQEALSNVQRHARATQVNVEVEIGPLNIRLSVRDNGCGFIVPAKLSQFMDCGHFGLVGMRERVDLIGGRLTLDSSAGCGTCLEVHVPL